MRCAEEYRLIARAVIHHILEGWQNQTGGRGTIDDLLLQPANSRPAKEEAPAEGPEKRPFWWVQRVA